jgi:hypothetical protein
MLSLFLLLFLHISHPVHHPIVPVHPNPPSIGRRGVR